MYVILTSKPGQFRTEPVPGVTPVEAYDYIFYGKPKARFVIAELAAETKLRVIDEAPPAVTNLVPSKFLEHFDSIEAARRELHHLVSFGSMKITLAPVPLAA